MEQSVQAPASLLSKDLNPVSSPEGSDGFCQFRPAEMKAAQAHIYGRPGCVVQGYQSEPLLLSPILVTASQCRQRLASEQALYHQMRPDLTKPKRRVQAPLQLVYST